MNRFPRRQLSDVIITCTSALACGGCGLLWSSRRTPILSEGIGVESRQVEKIGPLLPQARPILAIRCCKPLQTELPGACWLASASVERRSAAFPRLVVVDSSAIKARFHSRRLVAPEIFAHTSARSQSDPSFEAFAVLYRRLYASVFQKTGRGKPFKIFGKSGISYTCC